MKIKREDKRRMKYLTRYCLFRAQCIQQQIGICKSSQKRRRRGLDGGWFGEILDIFIAFLFTRAKMRGGRVQGGAPQQGKNGKRSKMPKHPSYLSELFKMRLYFVVDYPLVLAWLIFENCWSKRHIYLSNTASLIFEKIHLLRICCIQSSDSIDRCMW